MNERDYSGNLDRGITKPIAKLHNTFLWYGSQSSRMLCSVHCDR